MGENAGQESFVPDGSQGQDQSFNSDQGTGNVNPAWNDVLAIIPKELHSQVTPHLSKWDQNYQTGINKVHSQYEAWKPFVEGGVDPQDANFALGLMNAISENPQEVIAALNEWVGGEQGNQQQSFEQQGQQIQNTPEFDLSQHPQFQEMNNAIMAMSQILLGYREQEQSSQADAELENELQGLRDQYGDFDEEYVIGRAMADPELNLENAVKAYQAMTENILNNGRRPGPPILGSGGAIPNNMPDVGKMSSSDTKALVANILNQARGQ